MMNTDKDREFKYEQEPRAGLIPFRYNEAGQPEYLMMVSFDFSPLTENDAFLHHPGTRR